MYKETNIRSIFKGISWRLIATTATVVIIYFFFGRMDLAIAAGVTESILKVFLYWGHERIWHKLRWGKKKIQPFNLWFTGLPLSGKTTIANNVFNELEKLQIPIERLDSKDIRDVIPDIGYSRTDRNRHMHRIGHLIRTLQNNSISTVASFVSPYKESRAAIKNMVKNTVVVYIKASLVTCKKRDSEGKYIKALNGEYKNFTGVDDIYEEPQHAEIVIDTDIMSIDESSKEIVKFIKKRYIK